MLLIYINKINYVVVNKNDISPSTFHNTNSIGTGFTTTETIQQPIIVTHTNASDQEVYPKENPQYPGSNKIMGYQQVGVLVSKDMGENEPIILPLYGRKMISRDRWSYYCASDKYHLWKLSVMYENRDCQDEVGCNEIYDGVDVVIPDYANKVFKARIYKYRENLPL